jgi:hypothetical protein
MWLGDRMHANKAPVVAHELLAPPLLHTASVSYAYTNDHALGVMASCLIGCASALGLWQNIGRYLGLRRRRHRQHRSRRHWQCSPHHSRHR